MNLYHPQIIWFHACDKYVDFEAGYYILRNKLKGLKQ